MTWITADFPNLPISVRQKISAGTSTRTGGVSTGEYHSLNIAAHVDDDPINIQTNRAILREQHSLPTEPYWLNQTHSNLVVELPDGYHHNYVKSGYKFVEADASYCRFSGHVCAVMTADCLPLLIVDEQANEIAAIHAGWRGLANGVIENTLTKFNAANQKLHVWLGPAIGPRAFEVGQEVKDQFVAKDMNNEMCFITSANCSIDSTKYLCDIYALAKVILNAAGVENISGGDYCTVSDQARFYSYRRDGQTGRMVSMIWLNNETKN